MRSLDKARDGWDEFERRKRRFADELTIEESLRIFLSLQQALEPMMEETEEIFRAERMAYLAELQARLLKLEEWRKKNGTTSEPD